MYIFFCFFVIFILYSKYFFLLFFAFFFVNSEMARYPYTYLHVLIFSPGFLCLLSLLVHLFLLFISISFSCSLNWKNILEKTGVSKISRDNIGLSRERRATTPYVSLFLKDAFVDSSKCSFAGCWRSPTKACVCAPPSICEPYAYRQLSIRPFLYYYFKTFLSLVVRLRVTYIVVTS